MRASVKRTTAIATASTARGRIGAWSASRARMMMLCFGIRAEAAVGGERLGLPNLDDKGVAGVGEGLEDSRGVRTASLSTVSVV